jgi:hypothetical protein
MRLKKVLLAVFLLLGFLNFSLLTAQNTGEKKIEISIFGGYMAGAGVLTAENVASDLLTGMWSPWFGIGHTSFSWMTPAPGKLDTPLGASNLAKEPGFMAGVRLGFNVTPMFQIEFFYQYGFSAYKIDDSAWDEYAKTEAETLASFQNIIPSRNPNFTDNSVQAAGKTNMFGLNFNISIPTQSAITPYFSVGGGMMTFSDFPAISFSLTQSISASSSATYGLEVTYTSKTAYFFGGGVGLKIPLGDNFGIKAEARGNLAMLSFDKNLATPFSSTTGGWTSYTDFNKIVLTEKGTSFLIGGALGLYYCF